MTPTETLSGAILETLTTATDADLKKSPVVHRALNGPRRLSYHAVASISTPPTITLRTARMPSSLSEFSPGVGALATDDPDSAEGIQPQPRFV